MVLLIAVGTGLDVEAGDESGDFERGVPPLELVFRKGEPERPMTGGVDVLDGGLLGRLMEGLSQEEKKSSSASPEGVLVPSEGTAEETSLITTSPPNLSRAGRLVNGG